MSLYLKYRPQNLRTIVGQDHIVTTLRNALAHGALTHAYLFSGPRGTGKTSFARILAKAINCTALEEGIEPCNQCDNCQAILNGRLVDMIEIDAASNRGIDEIRDLKEKIQFSPTQGKAKVYIIDEVHMLTKEAFNALLKTLEEPPAHAFFILATTEVHKIPETILSRCQQFSFRRISEEDIVQRLGEIAHAEGIRTEPDALTLIARISNGGLRDAIGLLEQMTIDGAILYKDVIDHLGITGPVLTQAFFQALLDKDAHKAIDLIAQVNGMGQNLAQFTRELIAFLREQMLVWLNAKKEVGALVHLIEIFSEAKLLLSQAAIPQLPLEIAVIKACGYEISAPKAKPSSDSSSHKVSKEALEAPPATPPTEKKDEISDTSFRELTLDEVRQSWPRILEKVETPFIRMSLNDGEPIALEKGSLRLAFRSNSLMDKVANTVNQHEIQKAFISVFNTKVTLKLELKKVSLEPMSAPKKEVSSSVIDMAKEVFGN
jgi:DNA polymerase III subunit gamma/tau